jgi:hypothetical protein
LTRAEPDLFAAVVAGDRGDEERSDSDVTGLVGQQFLPLGRQLQFGHRCDDEDHPDQADEHDCGWREAGEPAGCDFLLQEDGSSDSAKGIVEVGCDLCDPRHCGEHVRGVGYLRSYCSFLREVVLVENADRVEHGGYVADFAVVQACYRLQSAADGRIGMDQPA